jgi:hypothetical protein
MQRLQEEIARILNMHLPMDLPWSDDHSSTKDFIVQNRPSSMYSLEFTFLLLLLEFYYGPTDSSTLVPEILEKLLCPNCQESISEEKTTEPVHDLEENLWSAISLCILA